MSDFPFLQACPICDKLYTKEHSFKRHVSYCRRAKGTRKGRPASCLSCHKSKTKCDFKKPQCGRCGKRGLACSYDDIAPLSFTKHPLLHSPQQNEIVNANPQQKNSQLIYAIDTQRESWNVGLPGTATDVVDIFGNFIEGALDWDTPSLDSCPWTPASFTPKGSIDDVIARSKASKALAPISQVGLASQHAANLIGHIVSAFPQMMLRKQTFPPFIYPHWNLSVAPEILQSCMSIAELFVSRTAQSRRFLWRSIDAELQHLIDAKNDFGAEELQQAIQAVTIYLIMAIVDQDDETPARGSRLMQAAAMLKIQQQLVLNTTAVAFTEQAKPSTTWEQWIFEESRRRTACLWFTIIRVFAIRTERATCSNLSDYRDLPLISSKELWDARSRQEWEELKFSRTQTSYPLSTFGELLSLRKEQLDDDSTRRLNVWEAGVDKLGMMMNIVVELVE